MPLTGSQILVTTLPSANYTGPNNANNSILERDIYIEAGVEDIGPSVVGIAIGQVVFFKMTQAYYAAARTATALTIVQSQVTSVEDAEVLS